MRAGVKMEEVGDGGGGGGHSLGIPCKWRASRCLVFWCERHHLKNRCEEMEKLRERGCILTGDRVGQGVV